MAKRQAKNSSTPTERTARTDDRRASAAKPSQTGAVETTVIALAEDLGRIIGTVQHKADTLLDKREGVAKRLVQIRDTASHMLSQLGDQVNSGYETVAGALSKPLSKTAGARAAKKKRVTATRAKATPAPASAVTVSSRRARVAKDDEARRRLSAKSHAQKAAVSTKARRAPR
jgi:hypothetical protein